MRTIKNPLLLTLLIFCIGTSSCIEDIFLEGNGVLLTEYRSAAGFDEITSNGDFNVTVVPGNNYSVEVTAESNLLSYIETDVVGRTLKIRTRGLYSLRDNRPIEIFVTTPVLNGLALSGSGLIETGSFSSDDFTLNISGSGDIDADISTDRMKATVSGSGTAYLVGGAYETDFRVSGSGKIKAYDFGQDHCSAVISGSGDMYKNVSKTIDASISGSGRVYYINYPVVHSNISGSGRVIDKN